MCEPGRRRSLLRSFGRFGFFCPWSNRRAQSLFGRHRLRVLGVEKGVFIVCRQQTIVWRQQIIVWSEQTIVWWQQTKKVQDLIVRFWSKVCVYCPRKVALSVAAWFRVNLSEKECRPASFIHRQRGAVNRLKSLGIRAECL